jgi:ABC-2 type transport system ATP-binding protein
LNAISIEHISKNYASSDAKALDDISLTIKKGSIVGILGPNGAGKTTLISSIVHLIKFDSGNITVLNQAHTNPSIKYKLGLVPQEYALYFELTPFENLIYFGRMLNIPKKKLVKKIDELLDVLGLTIVKNKRLKTFSGGMKRRVNLAASILNNPEILILDEPTVGVDVQSRAVIMNYLKQLNEVEGMTIVYTSHLMAEAQDFCRFVYIIDDGKIVVGDSPKNLMNTYEVKNLEEVFLKLTGKNK